MTQRQTPTVEHAIALYQSGDAAASAAACDAVLKDKPRDSRALRQLARARYALRDFAGAAEATRRELAITPVEPFAEQSLAAALTGMGLFDDALAALDRAEKTLPGTPAFAAARVETLLQARRWSEAASALQPHLARDPVHPEIAYAFARVASRLGRTQEAVALLERTLAVAPLSDSQRVAALYQLGGLREEIGDYSRAFDAWEQAGAAQGPRRGLLEYNASVARMLAAWSPQTCGRLPRARQESELPVYIVGMPRSGTSLIEQIIASHPQVHGADERQDILHVVREIEAPLPGPRLHVTEPQRLSQRDLTAYSTRVLTALSATAPGRQRISDKDPTNYLHLGLIGLLFPRGRVLHCRRDPLDTCLSCFSNNLTGPHMFGRDLRQLGAWYRQYERVVAHWATTGCASVLDVPYEELVAAPEAWTRRILEFLGLSWDERCLSFHETRRATLTPSVDQVRRPMYSSSIGRWKRFADRLEPLQQALRGA